MCLYTDGKLKVAKEDIIAYKVVRILSVHNISSLYQSYRIMFNTLLFSELEYSDGIVTKAFHLYATLKGAKKELDSCKNYNVNNAKIIKAIIPKGAKYYTGIFRLYTGVYINSDFDKKEEILGLKSIATNQVLYKEL